MTRRRTNHPRSSDTGAARPRVGPLRLWIFRIGASVLLPLCLLLVAETGLRLAGFGYSTAFLLREEHAGKKVFVQNDRFGWRFFGREQSRQPATFAIPRPKPPDTVRIFVFGESAAFGDPQPDFGLPRLLDAMLSRRHPGVRFEVVNAAMTGINSHTVLPLARDCASAEGDIWVLYMGNNEVVGPFGAGTVFGRQAAPRPFIQASLALQTLRTGQLVDRLVGQLRAPPPGKSEWGGMLMFLENRVRADDPRLATVYRNFEHNLEDIITAGRRAGAGVVVSTVAVNLEDCAPFASNHRPALAPSDEAVWRRIYERGGEAQRAGRMAEALALFREAAQIDDSMAELQFRWGLAARALGDMAEAQRRFTLARDLDTLRFRCDGPLNAITRRVAASRREDGVRLVDAEAALTRPEFFYEHVHLTFEGNYQLARQLAEPIEQLLPESVRRRALPDWATAEECAQRLVWTDANRLETMSDMLGRLQDPPFIWQLNHADQTRRFREQIGRLQPAAGKLARTAGEIFRAALMTAPDDAILHAQHTAWLTAAGDLPSATASARRVVELQPNNVTGWAALGDALVEQNQFTDAAKAYEEGLRRDPDNFWARHNLARIYLRLDRRDQAEREYRRVLQLKPRFGPAHLGLGQLLESAGQPVEAEKHFQLALTHRVRRAEELASLARFCHERGWFQAAATNYLDALQLNSGSAPLHLGAAQCLTALGRRAEASPHLAEAARLAPDSGESHFLSGVDLGRQGRLAAAAEQFREAVRLLPNLVEARVNLGIALAQSGREAEALEQFKEVLRRSPTNAVALQQVQALRQTGTPPPPR